MISAISLGQWLERLTAMDLMLVTRRLEGYTLTEIADEVGKSITVTCQRLQQLGEDLAQHARLSVPRRARKPRRSSAQPHLAAA